MKSNVKKIKKLLGRSAGIIAPLFDGNQKGSAKSDKKREKKLDKAELLCRKALALCREDTAEGTAEAGGLLIECVDRLSEILFRRGRQEEAEPMLADICAGQNTDSDSPWLSGCLAYYGSLLCESGRYDDAAPVLDGFLTRVKAETADNALPSDVYAVCRGLGNAGYAFTYSDTEEGFSTEHFVAPADILTRLSGQGVEVGDGNLKKAESMRQSCEEYGWTAVSMRDDWTTIYGDGVTRK